mgnify:CR=1 FL=1|jgi:crotonobetainyl-CoA:carnitine CoA-transferase CaiB-like acyl-CoA transferase
MSNSDKRPGALDGIRVIDLTSVLMGPLACRMLADHGADVIQVVPPSASSSVMGDATGMGGISLDIQRNKRSVRLDLKSEEGKSALWELVTSADVLVSNMRAAALDRLGFSAAAVRARHPKLIYCLANGYGEDGPYADRAAYDDAIQALSGFAGLSTRLTGKPTYAPSVIVDKTCSLFIVQAVMAALLYRHSHDEGQTINVPMFETMAAFNLIEHFRGAALVPPQGTIGYSRLLNPERRPYESADGWIAMVPYTESNWRDFFDIIGTPKVLEDPRFATHNSRMNNIESLYGLVAKAAPTRTTQQWLDVCDAHSIPCNPVLNLEDLLDDPHLKAVDLMPIVEHPSVGKYRTVRDPVKYEKLSTELRRHAPIPGEHTAEIMRELGWSDEQIKAL